MGVHDGWLNDNSPNIGPTRKIGAMWDDKVKGEGEGNMIFNIAHGGFPSIAR
jgi:hypothetical protein